MEADRGRHTEFDCPACGHTLLAPRGFGGRIVACPRCRRRLIVPQSLSVAPDPTPSTPPTIPDLYRAKVFRWGA